MVFRYTTRSLVISIHWRGGRGRSNLLVEDVTLEEKEEREQLVCVCVCLFPRRPIGGAKVARR